MVRHLVVREEVFPLARVFRISRGARSEARVVVCEIEEDGFIGRGECVPYPRYGETVEEVLAAIAAIGPAIAGGLGREGLTRAMRPGAARNAVDCALWDLEAKRAGRRVWDVAALAPPQPLVTAFTLGVDTPEAMAEAATRASRKPILKLKLAGDGLDGARIAAVRAAAPEARLIADANEALTLDELHRLTPTLAEARIDLLEQPLPADADEALRGSDWPVPIGADESVHDTATLERLVGLYAVVNLKLDKTGGLTEALRLRANAERLGLRIMVGCMVGSSLAIAPAHLLAQGCDFVDLDGPLWLARDREHGLRYEDGVVHPPEAALWG